MLNSMQETPYVEDTSLVRSNSSLASITRSPSAKFLEKKPSLKPSDIVFIRSRLNGLYITIKNKSTAENAALVMKSFSGNEEQQFSWQGKSLVSLLSGKAIDISENLLVGLTNKGIVLRDFSGGAISSQNFDYNDYGQIVSAKYPHMCIDVKNASTSKGASLILFPLKGPHQQDSANQLFDFIPKNKQSMTNLDSCQFLKKMGGYNGAVSLMMGETKIFFKPLSSQKAILLESAGSLMTNYITGGLVNLSHRAIYQGKTGIYQEFVVMNEKPFRTPDLKFDKKYVIDYSTFNSKQWHQLFCHMIADRLISNWDTHNENFATNDKGDVISYDKEKCFYLFELGGSVLTSIDWKEDYRKLDLHKNLWKSPTIMAKNHNLYFVHGSLCQRIFEGAVKIDPNDPIIQDMFKRCEAITMEKVRECFGEYALYKYHSESQAEFLHIIYKRIKNIRKPVYRFFKWPNEPENVDTEPYVFE